MRRRNLRFYHGGYLSLLLVFILAACGSAPSATTTTTTTAATATQISIATSLITVKSDNSDTATITATVLDSANAAVLAQTVTFSSTGGQLSAASGTSDANGKVAITLSSGVADPSNRTVTVTATISGTATSASIPIQISGSTVSLSTTTSGLTDAPTSATLTVSAKNAAAVAVNNTAVTFTQSGTGTVTITPATGNTDINGQLQATVSGATAGSVTVTASALGTTAAQTYTVSAAGAAFAITTPATDPLSLTTSTAQTITVNAPGVTTVTFATSLGTVNGAATADVAVAGGIASATFTSASAGVATVQAFDKAVPTTTDKTTIAVAAPAASASQVALQTNVSVLAPSTTSVTHVADLSATVRNGAGQPVGNAAVAFNIVNPTGGGESLSIVVAITNSSGVATTQFTSGSSSSSTGVNVKATVVGTIFTSTVNIVIGGTAGSVVISSGSLVTTVSSTQYALPMSVLIADSNGNPVSGATVSLNIWPAQFSSGFYFIFSTSPTVYNACVSGTYLNEDLNKNLTLDAGEDVTHTEDKTCLTLAAANVNTVLDTYAVDSALTPANSAGGTVPSTVTTNASGVANFDLNYLKNSASWIVDEITASTLVFGTETSSTLSLRLPADKVELESGILPESPYGNIR
ncbi:MAG: Ig-like domain-containing protein [Mariprofundaceae bacterium]